MFSKFPLSVQLPKSEGPYIPAKRFVALLRSGLLNSASRRHTSTATNRVLWFRVEGGAEAVRNLVTVQSHCDVRETVIAH